MIAIHYGTPHAIDVRVREGFIEHVCQVNEELQTEKEDLISEKAALAEENDALMEEAIALRHEVRQYALVEQKGIAHRKRDDEKLAMLRPQAEELHRIASCVGVPPGDDVTTATLPRVTAYKTASDKLDQINAIIHRDHSATRFSEICTVLLGDLYSKKEPEDDHRTDQGA
ncbi:hypothetical protein L0636_01150 [Halomonas janggokensis]|uniref:Uncharacterized protein n=1 Tax=Vreelandella janggokensis TaxID=370767 RepID=A0ABT4ISR1_9GAMM|nr:hypothetical protein [Halomonas janggokensis]MCZ0926495.1 hypothetical protein [Halomonas janggokensis]MCZ0929033.1 hypothetical protein [Halomonas janggokensis]